MKGIGLVLVLTVIVALPCFGVDYWWVQSGRGMLVHVIAEADSIRVDSQFRPANRRSVIAIHPIDGTCWVTDPFQGRVTQYTPQHKKRDLTGFAAPTSLVLHPHRNTLWIADAALHFVMEVSMTGKTLQQIQIHSPKALAIGPDGNGWVLTWRGMQPIINGHVESPIQKEVQLIASTPDATAVWSVNQKGLIHRFDANGTQRLPFALPDCKGIVGTPDGGCWLFTPRQAIRISGQMELIGEVTGFDSPKGIVYQPTDGSTWVTDSGYDRTVRLPAPDAPSTDELSALVGWDSVTKTGTITRELVTTLHWESFVTPAPEESPAIAETSRPDAPPPSPIDAPPNPPLQEVVPAPDGERPTAPEVESEAAEENDQPILPPSAEDPDEEMTPAPEVAPEQREENEAPTPTFPDDEPDNLEDGMPEVSTPEKPEPPEVSTKPQEEPANVGPTIVRIPPNETFEHIPVLPNGGITFVKLYDELSQRRIQDTEETLGRRFIWNFDGQSYTLLLGLSVDAYNTYSNRARDTWVKMVIEGIPAAGEIVKPMQELAQQNGWSREKLANFVISFAQSLPYTADDVATGYDEFKMYGFETLVAGGGDCEDTVILATSILLALDYDLMLLNPKGHLALGVAGNFSGAYFEHNDKRYFYSETTGTGWNIGDIPDMYASVPVTLYEVSKHNPGKE